MGCCTNPQKDEKTEFALDFEVLSKDEPKLDLSENNGNLLDDNANIKSSQITDIERKGKSKK